MCIDLATLERLAKLEGIVGIKEASDSADRLVKLAAFGEELPLYAGNDSQTYTALALGGAGVISVLSNLCPDKMRRISTSYFAGRHGDALTAQTDLLGLIDAMFVETNPAPVKYALARLGLCREDMRLPMATVCEKSREVIDRAMQDL